MNTKTKSLSLSFVASLACLAIFLVLKGCSEDVWIANTGNDTVSKIVELGTPVVTPLAASLLSPYTTPASKP